MVLPALSNRPDLIILPKFPRRVRHFAAAAFGVFGVFRAFVATLGSANCINGTLASISG